MKLLVSFAATVVVAAPIALQADIQSDGPKLRPPEQQVRVGDATVTLQLDRGLVKSGKQVSAILVASSERAHDVAVDLTTLEDMGYGGERVPNPPLTVDRRKLVLHAEPGGGAPVVASLVLGSRRDVKGLVEWYDVIVTPHGGKPDGETAARVELGAWTGNQIGFAIEPPATMPLEGPFTVGVRIVNTTKQPIAYEDLEVGTRIRGWDSLDRTLELYDDDFDVTPVDDEPAESLQPGAEKVLHYQVTPKRWGIPQVTVVAWLRGAGAIETRTFERPEPPEPEPAAAAPVAAR